MRTRIFAALIAAAALLAPTTSLADYQVKDGNGAPLTFCSKTTSSVHSACHVTTGVAYGASGVTPVTGSASATGQSATLAVTPGRPVNLAFSGTGVFAIQLERQFSGDSTWYPVYAGGVQRAWSTTGATTVTVSDSYTETESGVGLRFRITSCSGCSLTYRLSQ